MSRRFFGKLGQHQCFKKENAPSKYTQKLLGLECVNNKNPLHGKEFNMCMNYHKAIRINRTNATFNIVP